MLPPAAAVPPMLDAFACSTDGSANVPFMSLPVLLVLGSEIDSVASPAVEITLAVVPAVYGLATPGVNGANDAGAPSESDRVAGTEPEAPPSASSAATSRRWVCTGSTLPAMSCEVHLIVYAP